MSDLEPGISVGFLVKEPPMDRFAMLIEFLHAVAAEIVIVDTGSSDRDKALMRSWSAPGCPVTVIEREFIDFSQARNEGINIHRHQWTLILDPDEIPSILMMHHIRQVTANQDKYPGALGWLYWTVNYWGGERGPEEPYHWHCRLFKTEHGRFYRPVHELVRLANEPEANTRGTPMLPYAPPEAYLIHSKPADELARADKLYAELGEVSR